jgi:hypothetical protein
MVYDDAALQNPIAETAERAVVRGTSDDYYGAFSVETFAEASSLTYTHEDAQGWYNYVAQFNTPNFWYKDGGVQPWAYYEDYDNWQDTYGMDAVNAVYHSGHGTMDANGVFYAPLGAKWGNLGSWVRSDQMRLGNEQVNYIFWSTCLSCRVLDGQTPMRTWSPANLGFRMLFGFETVSWDSPNYGKFFWEEWNKQKSFSSAWLDASWRIAHDQAPSAVACGASQAEASDRVFNERLFYWAHASTAWWWWRWYNAARFAFDGVPPRQPNLQVPREIAIAKLASPSLSHRRVRELINGLGLEMQIPGRLTTSRSGTVTVREGGVHLTLGSDGSFRAQLRNPNRENRAALPKQRALRIAEDFARQVRLSDDVEVVFDQIRVSSEAGASDRGTGRVEGPYTSETMIQYRQIINGVPVITPGHGELHLTLDNDGQITSVQSSLRSIERVFRSGADGPPEPSATPRSSRPEPENDFEESLAAAWSRQLLGFAAGGPIPASFSVVPGSTEVGYSFEGDRAILIAQRAIEVDCGRGLRKRYWVRAPLGQ